MKKKSVAESAFAVHRVLAGLLLFGVSILLVNGAGDDRRMSAPRALLSGVHTHKILKGELVPGTPMQATGPSVLPSLSKITTPTRATFMASWESVSAASGYRIDVSSSRLFNSFVNEYQDLDVGNATGRLITGLSPGTTYYCRVRTYNAGGVSSYSEVKSATTVSTTGLTINPTFDSSILNDPDSVAIQAMINQAIAIYESLFSDPFTISILFRYATTAPDGSPLSPGTLALSFSVVYSISWDDYISMLQADATTSNDAMANASLPGASLSPNIEPTSAGGRAVGLDTPPAMFANGTVGNGGPYDGIVTLNSSQPFQFDRPPDTGNFDALRATEHEIDEVMGLGSYLDFAGNDLDPQDLFSWSAPGNRNITSSGLRYFSIDSGSTNIVRFNQDPGGDRGDWFSPPCPQANPYVQNAFGCPEQYSDVEATSPEGINLDVIGYDLMSGPSAPTASAATNITSTSFTANWSGVSGANGYRLDVSTSNTFASYVTGYHDLDVGNVTSVTVSGLSPSTTYYYRVRSYDNSGVSANSNTVTVSTAPTAPAAPTANAASSITNSSFVANWTAVSGATGYRLDVSTNASFSSFVSGYQDLDVGNVTSRSVTGLSAGGTYYYRVRARNGGAVSGNSNVISVTLVPAAPTAIAASGITSHWFTANWNSSTGTGGYRLDVSTTNSFATYLPGYQDRNVGSVTSFGVKGLVPSTSYYYRVRAFNGAGLSGNSNVITVLTAAPPNPTPVPSPSPKPSAPPGPPPTPRPSSTPK